MRSNLRLALSVLGLFLYFGTSFAIASEVGVSDQEVVIGQSLGLTGPLAQMAPDIANGGKACFDAINAKGGVYGRKIRAVVVDDGYDAAATLKTVRQLIDNDHVFALYSLTGTANVLGVLPMLAKEPSPVPLIGPITGADAVRNPPMANVFHVRASYADELDKLIQHLATLGVQRIGVLWINNGMGKDGMAGMDRALHKHAIKPYASASIQPDGSDTAQAVTALHDRRPEVIIMITAGTPTVSFIKAYNKVQKGMRFYTLSVMGTQSAVRALGVDGVGVVVTSVVPYPWSNSSPLAREYRDAMHKSGYDNLSFLGFESYINAKVLVEGLKRAGKDLTRAKLIDVMESMKTLNLGGFTLNFSKDSHQGSRFVELTIISPGEKFTK